MDSQEFVSLIDQLGATAAECRELLSDMRSMEKTLRGSIKEANEVVDRLIEKKLDERISDELKPMLERCEQGFKAVEAKVSRKIEKLADAFLKGPKKGPRVDLRDLM